MVNESDSTLHHRQSLGPDRDALNSPHRWPRTSDELARWSYELGLEVSRLRAAEDPEVVR